MANLRLASQDYMAVTRAMDTNGNHKVDKNEANIGRNAHSGIGNSNGVAGTRELATALEKGDVFLNRLSEGTADKIASYFSKRNENFDRPVAEWISDAWISKADFEMSDDVRRAVDANGDNKVSRKEFAAALVSGTLTIGETRQASHDPFKSPASNDPFKSPSAGRDPFKEPAGRDPFKTPSAGRDPFKAPVNHDPFKNDPFKNPGHDRDPFKTPGHDRDPFNQRPGYGVDAHTASRFIDSLNSNKMQQDSWGNYKPGTGAFKPSEANAEIRNYISENVIHSSNMSLTDKLALLDKQMMDTDSWGNYQMHSGSLKSSEAVSFAKQAVAFETENFRDASARGAADFINLIESHEIDKDSWGNDKVGTGVLKASDTKAIIKDFLSNHVVNSRRMGLEDKLALIKDQTMGQDSWGNYKPETGTLTANEANELSKAALRNSY